jgi:hypothetical protein
MKAIRPGQYKLISFTAIFCTVLGGLFFLILIPLIAPRDVKFAGVLLIMGIAIFALGIFVTLTALIYLFLKMPKK